MSILIGDTDADNKTGTGLRVLPAPFGRMARIAGHGVIRSLLRLRFRHGTKRVFGITSHAGHILLLLVAGLFLASEAQAAPPNIVLILADDLGYADPGFNGGTQIRTPHIDALAQQGTIFDAGYVAAAVCAPSRAGLLTGRYPQRFGLENNQPEGINQGLPLTEQTIADLLHGSAPVGYTTGFVGKWHLGGGGIYHPERRGFDYAYGFYPDASAYMPPLTLYRNGAAVTETRYLTTAFGEEAAAFIDNSKNSPFFLYLSFNAPHTPLQAPKSYLDQYPTISDQKRHTYAAMVSAMDDAVGAVATALQRNNLDRNTLIFFLSDNGGQIGEGADNGPLRGRKGFLYEGGIRIPFFVRWQGRIPSGRHYVAPASALDVLPTIVAATGAKLPTLPVDGINLLPYLTGSRTPLQRSLFWRADSGTSNEQFAAQVGGQKLLFSCGNTAAYNLKTDIGERTDIATPDLLTSLKSDYDAWAKQMVSPLWPSAFNNCEF